MDKGLLGTRRGKVVFRDSHLQRFNSCNPTLIAPILCAHSGVLYHATSPEHTCLWGARYSHWRRHVEEKAKIFILPLELQ